MGCRRRGATPDLLRVVAVDGVLAVDRGGRLPGRGAYVHPELACVELAERRQ
ncbi:MAG: YlxR family protein, partial [Mycobacteriales bacterium]